MNKTARIAITRLISFIFPVNNLSSTKASIPKTIPSAMLYVNGIIMIVTKAGIDSVKSSKFIFTIGDIIKNPTNTKAATAAAAGTSVNIGAKIPARRTMVAVESDVEPVLPPSATPDALSTYVVTVLVPSIEPTVVPTESANSACLALGTFPFLSSMPALEETPTNVPTVSNISTNKKVNRIINMSNENILSNSN